MPNNTNSLTFSHFETYAVKRQEFTIILSQWHSSHFLQRRQQKLLKAITGLFINMKAFCDILDFYGNFREHQQTLCASSETKQIQTKP